MSEQELLSIIADNIRIQMQEKGLTIADVARELGVSHTAASNWCKGQKMPRVDKIDAMCRLFGCRRSDLLEKKATADVDRLAEELKENPHYRMLLSAARDLKPEDFHILMQIAEKLRQK